MGVAVRGLFFFFFRFLRVISSDDVNDDGVLFCPLHSALSGTLTVFCGADNDDDAGKGGGRGGGSYFVVEL